MKKVDTLDISVAIIATNHLEDQCPALSSMQAIQINTDIITIPPKSFSISKLYNKNEMINPMTKALAYPKKVIALEYLFLRVMPQIRADSTPDKDTANVQSKTISILIFIQ